MNGLQIFDSPEFGHIRAIERDGDPWFVGKDLTVEEHLSRAICQLPEIVATNTATAVNAARRAAEFNELDRQEIERWKTILLAWREHRAWLKDKESADAAFLEKFNDEHPEAKILRRTLYRKWKAYNKRGDEGLLDWRGRHGNHRHLGGGKTIPGVGKFVTNAEYAAYQAEIAAKEVATA